MNRGFATINIHFNKMYFRGMLPIKFSTKNQLHEIFKGLISLQGNYSCISTSEVITLTKD